jgi:pimeloyl-ACP methyl ester carboxylesterase
MAVTAADLDVLRVGSGPRVVLVHGSVVAGQRMWRHQLDLSERWSLCIPDRPGFGASPSLERGDFEAEAPLIADLLEDGAHLVGHSYGGVIALLAAALRPQAVRSLTVSEPGALRVARGVPAVDQMVVHGERLYAARAEIPPAEFLRLFRGGVNSDHETPEELPDWLERGARHLRAERPSWEAELPLEALAAAPFPKLVISGGHSEAFDAVCDAIAAAIGAERAVVAGRAHTIPGTGRPYNGCLEEFLLRA